MLLQDTYRLSFVYTLLQLLQLSFYTHQLRVERLPFVSRRIRSYCLSTIWHTAPNKSNSASISIRINNCCVRHCLTSVYFSLQFLNNLLHLIFEIPNSFILFLHPRKHVLLHTFNLFPNLIEF